MFGCNFEALVIIFYLTLMVILSEKPLIRDSVNACSNFQIFQSGIICDDIPFRKRVTNISR